jgi:hypothetical protein
MNWVIERYDEHSYWQILLSNSHHTLFLIAFFSVNGTISNILVEGKAPDGHFHELKYM